VRTTDGGTSWSFQAPVSNDLNDVHAVDANTAWAVGTGGVVLHTANGGLTWSAQDSGTTRPLNGVFFTDLEHGWAVGNDGTLIATSNGGTTWTPQTSNTTADLQAVFFLDALTGWATGSNSVLLRTTDGGTTWIGGSSGPPAILFDLYFVDANNGWSVGSGGTIRRTTDGGITWNTQVSHTSQGLRAVYFVDTNTGWAVGEAGVLLHTNNGGVDWNPQVSNVTDQGSLFAVYALDANTAWVSGFEVAKETFKATVEREDVWIVLRTNDGGANWNRQIGGLFPRLRGVHFLTDKLGWVTGGNGQMLHTTDGGRTWALISIAAPDWLSRVYFADENTGWAVGRYGVITRSTDGGRTWRQQDSGYGGFIFDVQMWDAQRGWVAGNGGQVWRTSNGGNTWILPDYLLFNTPVYGISFISPSQGWAVSEVDRVRETVDGGQNWFGAAYTGLDCDWFGVDFTDELNGWIVGEKRLDTDLGRVGHTTDGGDSWQFQDAAGAPQLNAIDMTDALTGWAVGYGGWIISTTDGGATWLRDTTNVTGHLNDVNFYDATHGWAVGEHGVILAFGGPSRTLTSFEATAAPTIDGDLGDWTVGGEAVLDKDTADTVASLIIPEPEDLSGRIRSRWDGSYLYLAVEVTDPDVVADSPSPADDDSVEIGLDGAYDQTPGGADDHQYRVDTAGNVTDFGNPAPNIQAAVSRTASGYNVELAIPVSALGGSLNPDRIIGFTWGLRDDDDGGSGDSYVIWEGSTTGLSSGDYGRLRLVGSPATFQQGVNGYDGADDTYITSWFPNENHGADIILRVRRGGEQAALLRFDTASLPSAVQVEAATLSLHTVGRSNSFSEIVSSYAMSRTWAADQANWWRATASQAWGIPGANDTASDRSGVPSDSQTVSAIGRWYHWNVTEMVRDWIVDPTSNKGIYLGGNGENNVQYDFASSEYAEVSIRPRLVITYTLPLPTPTPTPTSSPTPTDTSTPTATPTATDTPIPTATPTATETPTPTPTDTPSPTPTDTPSPTATPTDTPTPTPMPMYLPVIVRSL